MKRTLVLSLAAFVFTALAFGSSGCQSNGADDPEISEPHNLTPPPKHQRMYNDSMPARRGSIG